MGLDIYRQIQEFYLLYLNRAWIEVIYDNFHLLALAAPRSTCVPRVLSSLIFNFVDNDLGKLGMAVVGTIIREFNNLIKRSFSGPLDFITLMKGNATAHWSS